MLTRTRTVARRSGGDDSDYHNTQGALVLDALIASGLVAAAYAVRKLNSAYEGYCLRVRRSSDNAEMDFDFTASGDLDIAAITTWLGGVNGFIVTWYDQSGNGHNAAQATDAAQPLFVASSLNTRPSLRGDGTDDTLSFPDAFAGQTSASGIMALRPSRIASTQAHGWQVGASQPHFGYTGGDVYDGFFSTTRPLVIDNEIVDDTPYLYSATQTGTQLQVWLNTVSKYDQPATFALPASRQIMFVSGLNAFQGDVFEVMFFTRALTDGERQPLETDINNYYGLFF